MKVAALRGDGGREPAGAARRRAVVAGRRQHRSPPDGGAAAAGPELAGAVADGQGHHGQQRRRARPAWRRRPVPAQSRRPADHAASRRLGVRPAEDQPRSDRRVPDRDQHVRHHAGPLDRDAGAGDLPLGHQRPARRRPTGSSATTASTPPTRSRTRCCPSRTSRPAARSAARSSATRRTSSGPTSTSGNRARRSLQPTRLPHQTFEFETKPINKNYLGRVDYQLSSKDNLHGPRPALGVRQPVPIASGTAHPSTAEQLRQRSTNVFGTWTHVVSTNLMMQVHGGYNGFSWFNDAIPSNDVQFYNTPFFVPQFQFPGLTLGGQRNYPNYTWQDTYSSRAGCELAPGTARDEIRRRVPPGQGHEELVAEPPRHLRVLHPAVGRRAGAALPGRRLERPVALGHQRPRAVPAAVRHQLPPGLPRRHAAADAGAVVRRQLAVHRQPVGQFRRPLRRGLGRDQSALCHRHA